MKRAVLFLLLILSAGYAESATVNKLAVLNAGLAGTATFNDSELIGFRIEIGLNPSVAELPATFSFTVRNPADSICLNIGNYRVESGQSYCGGQMLNIPN